MDNTIYPFEIKKTANPSNAMINNLRILENKNINVGNGGLLCFYPDIIPLDEKNKSFNINNILIIKNIIVVSKYLFDTFFIFFKKI